MNWIKHKAFMKVVAASTILLACGHFEHPSFAGEGDSSLEAFFLPIDTEVTGIIGADYLADYYKVIVPTTGRLIVRLYDKNLQDPGDQLNIYLIRVTRNSIGSEYNSYSNYVAQSKNNGTTPDIIDIPDLTRGVYFVIVQPVKNWPSWDGADYKLRAEFTVFPPVVSDDIGDERRYALPTVNQLPTNCTLDGSNDVDYFECHVPYNTNLTLMLSDIGPEGNVDMEVYTSWDVMIGSSTQGGNEDDLLYLPDLVPGQYFIRIFGQGTTKYTFTASYEFAKATDILDDVGNNLVNAMPLLPGNPSVFCLQPYNMDSDVFSIYQPEDGPLTVDVYDTFLWDGGDDLYVQVLDEYGNLMAKSDNATLIPEHIELNLPRGQYFVSVYGERNWPTFDGAIYTINVKTSGYDVGDAFNQAMQIHAIPYGTETYGYPYIGMIDQPGDTDFFQIILKDNGYIYLEIDRMLHSNVDVQLFDAYYNLLQTSASPDTKSEVIYVDNLDAGLYFIKVYSPDDSISQYRLTPTVGTPTSTISDDIGDDTSRAFPLVPYRRVDGYFWNDTTNDYFRFALEVPTEWVRISVYNQHVWDKGDDIILYVYNSSGDQIGSSDNDVLEDEYVEFDNLDAGIYYARVAPQNNWPIMDSAQYSIIVETDTAPLPSAELYIPVDIQGIPGEIIYASVILENIKPDEISSMSIGVQFDPNILEPIGVSNAGLTLEQWNAQVRYTRGVNVISASMNNFTNVQNGGLLNLIFKVSPTAIIGDESSLTVLVSALNGATVPGKDGLVRITDTVP